jgi:UDP-glucose 4-epimerase
LRYFNPIGAHPSIEIHELPVECHKNLVPFITQTGRASKRTLVYGNDYLTVDGTCIRDYIHIVDLASNTYCFAAISEQNNAEKSKLLILDRNR